MFDGMFTTEESVRAIERIAGCPDESSLNQLIRRIMPALGATSHIFTTILRNEASEGRENHRFLIGCMPELCQFYNGRKWYINDPCLIYARNNSAAIPICDIPCTTHNQKRLLFETFPQWGFKSGVVIPAHSGTSDRMGAFYVGSAEDPETGNATLMQHRVMIRAIAMELLDWWITRIRREALQNYRLDEMDLSLLQLQKQGFTAPAIGDELGVSARTIHNRVKRIKAAFGADNINAAVRMATMYGLIS